MSKFVTTVEYGGAHNLAADITANVTTGQSRQFFKQILCRAVNKGPKGSFCWRRIFSSTSFRNGKITMKFLILNSRKISQICVWARTENTNYRYLSTLKYGGFTNFIILVTSLTLDLHMWISLVFIQKGGAFEHLGSQCLWVLPSWDKTKKGAWGLRRTLTVCSFYRFCGDKTKKGT